MNILAVEDDKAVAQFLALVLGGPNCKVATANNGEKALAKIDAARAAGQDVGACMYPYTAGATGLTSVLPPWTAADGKLFENLEMQEKRACSFGSTQR